MDDKKTKDSVYCRDSVLHEYSKVFAKRWGANLSKSWKINHYSFWTIIFWEGIPKILEHESFWAIFSGLKVEKRPKMPPIF